MSMSKCPYCAEEIQADAVKCKHCGSWLTGDPVYGPVSQPGVPPVATAPLRLLRSDSDRMIAGICGGAARYVGLDSTLLRIVVAVATVFTGIVPGIIAYFALVFIIPREDAF